MRTDPGVPDILAEAYCSQHEAVVQIRGQVFHGMHGEFGIAAQQRSFQLLDEQTLAPKGTQAGVEPPVALRGHADQLHAEPRVMPLEFGFDEVGLPERQPALARSDPQLLHWCPGTSQEGACMPWHPAICKRAENPPEGITMRTKQRFGAGCERLCRVPLAPLPLECR